MLKGLAKKHWACGRLDYEAVDAALLKWRNVPCKDELSPAQWLIGHRLRTLSYLELTPKGQEEALCKSKELDPLPLRQLIRIQKPISKLWNRCGTVDPIRDNGWSYVVKIGTHQYTRNQRFLCPPGLREPPEISAKSTV
eukprot:TCALIF_05010-PA protein Name:"Protein of unknown function" AED:0.10 eAED:0.21 QI:49/0/0/0.66/0/0/3/0/138